MAGGTQVSPAVITAEIEASRNELKLLVARMNEIYREISKSVYSTSQLVAVTAPPYTRVTHAVDPRKLILWGVVVVLAALPISIFACILHNRFREEEMQAEQLAALPG